MEGFSFSFSFFLFVFVSSVVSRMNFGDVVPDKEVGVIL